MAHNDRGEPLPRDYHVSWDGEEELIVDHETGRLLCPICKEAYQGGQILQCADGHLFCIKCSRENRGRFCPNARCQRHVQKNRPIRNRQLENIFEDTELLRETEASVPVEVVDHEEMGQNEVNANANTEVNANVNSEVSSNVSSGVNANVNEVNATVTSEVNANVSSGVHQMVNSYVTPAVNANAELFPGVNSSAELFPTGNRSAELFPMGNRSPDPFSGVNANAEVNPGVNADVNAEVNAEANAEINPGVNADVNAEVNAPGASGTSEEANARPGHTAGGFLCDVCSFFLPISGGFRYRCLNCPDFHICEKCVESGHHSQHPKALVSNTESVLKATALMPFCRRNTKNQEVSRPKVEKPIPFRRVRYRY